MEDLKIEPVKTLSEARIYLVFYECVKKLNSLNITRKMALEIIRIGEKKLWEIDRVMENKP